MAVSTGIVTGIVGKEKKGNNKSKRISQSIFKSFLGYSFVAYTREHESL